MIISEPKNISSLWTLWFKWIILNALGDVIGALVGGSIGYIFFPTDAPRFALVAGLIAGFIFGFAQWLLLRQLINGVGWWILATGVALAIGDPIGTIVVTRGESVIPHLFAASLGSLVIGSILGFLQWLIFRKKFGGASTTWIVAILIASLVGTFISRIPNSLILGMLARGAVSGAITGYALVWLMQRFQQKTFSESA
jgi:hypothetical protein